MSVEKRVFSPHAVEELLTQARRFRTLNSSRCLLPTAREG